MGFSSLFLELKKKKIREKILSFLYKTKGKNLLQAITVELLRDFPVDRDLSKKLFLLSEQDKNKLLHILEKTTNLEQELEKITNCLALPQWSNLLQYGNLNSFSQDGEDLILRQLFSEKKRGFYIDIGAHHPYRFSNTAYFSISGWKGINIDPMPGTHLLFKKERPNDITCEIAIGNEEGEIELHCFNESALNTTSSSRLEYIQKNTSYQKTGTFKVPIKRLDAVLLDVLSENQAIDFLSNDVEGVEESVIKSNNWKRFRPKIILLEILDINLLHITANPIVKLMREISYIPFIQNTRTVFFKDSLSST